MFRSIRVGKELGLYGCWGRDRRSTASRIPFRVVALHRRSQAPTGLLGRCHGILVRLANVGIRIFRLSFLFLSSQRGLILAIR